MHVFGPVACVASHAVLYAAPLPVVRGAEPLVVLGAGMPLSFVAGLLSRTALTLVLPVVAGVAISVNVAVDSPPHSDAGPLDPVVVGAAFSIGSVLPVLVGLVMQHWRGRHRA